MGLGRQHELRPAVVWADPVVKKLAVRELCEMLDGAGRPARKCPPPAPHVTMWTYDLIRLRTWWDTREWRRAQRIKNTARARHGMGPR